MSDDFEATLKLEFLSEASELIENCEEAFLKLEADNGDEAVIDEIFRIAHTLKGSSLTVGFDGLGAFTHTFENLLMQIREHKVEATSEIVDILLEANDKLKEYVDALQDDQDAVVDTEFISDKLKESMVPEDKEDFGAFGFFDDDDEEEGEKPAGGNPGTDKNTSAIPQEHLQKDPTNIEGERTPNVLVCDDDKDLLELYEALLESMGYNITLAEDGVKGLEVFKNGKFDLILSDLQMPNMNGIQFIEEVRKIDQNVQVIFCSAFAERDEIIKFLEFGAYGFLDKPFDTAQFKFMIKSALKVKLLQEAVAQVSTLNFSAYLSAQKILQMIDLNETEKAHEIRQELSTKLDKIAKFTNFILTIGKK